MNPFCPLFPSTLYTLSVRQSLAPRDLNLHCYLIDQSCFVRIKIRVTLTLEGMLEAICAELGVERSAFGEEVVYRECQLSFPGVESPEFGQRPCRMSVPTPPPQDYFPGFRTFGFGPASQDTYRMGLSGYRRFSRYQSGSAMEDYPLPSGVPIRPAVHLQLLGKPTGWRWSTVTGAGREMGPATKRPFWRFSC